MARLAGKLPPSTLAEAAGLRALRQALESLRAMGLDQYAAETRKLVAQS